MFTSHKYRAGGIALTALATMVVTGCADEAGPLPDVPQDELTIEYAGVVISEKHDVVAGLEVCAYGLELPCALTDASGAYLLMLPDKTHLALTYSGVEDFHPMLEMVTTGAAGRTFKITKLHSYNWFIRQAMGPGVVLDVGRSNILVQVLADEVGYRFSVEPGDKTVFYVDDEGNVDTALKATTSASVALIVGVMPNSYEVAFTKPPWSVDCETSGWQGYTANSTIATTAAGFITYVTQSCNATPMPIDFN